MKPVRSMVMAFMAMVLFSGCATTQVEFARQQNAVYETWIGHHKSELIQKLGPPTSVASDGKDGEIFIYDRSKTSQTQGTAQINPYWNTITYDSPQLEKTEIYTQFFCDRNGIIYNYRWKNSYYSGSHSEYLAANKGIKPKPRIESFTVPIQGIVYHSSKDRASIISKAEAGEAEFQFLLGFMYGTGQGIERDYAEALKWYRKAADQGLAPAQREIGQTYISGEGVTQDFAEAYKWYRKAADQGDWNGQYTVGFLYHNGHGVTRDFVEAYKWYDLAAAQGCPEAITNRDQVLKQMTPEQIAEGQRLVKEWKPKSEATAGNTIATPAIKKTNTNQTSSVREKLKELKALRADGLISEEAYKKKVEDLLKEL